MYQESNYHATFTHHRKKEKQQLQQIVGTATVKRVGYRTKTATTKYCVGGVEP